LALPDNAGRGAVETEEGATMHGAIATAEQIGPQSAEEDSGLRYYVILMSTGLERRACIWMRLRGLDPYWARYRVIWREFQARHGIQWRSVLPGYLFLPHPADCKLVEDAPGVRRFLRDNDGRPKTIDQYDMDRIREIEAALNDSIIAARDGIPFKVGQLVYVKRLEQRGKILRLDGRRRIIIEVFMFGSFLPMTLSVADIESI
jgi:transcription antitermination factor NusG